MIPNKDYIGSLPGAIHDKDGTLTDILKVLGVKQGFSVRPISKDIKNDGRLQPPVATFRVGDSEYSIADVLDAVTTKLETKVISCLISVDGQRYYLTNAAQLVAALDDIEVNPVRCSRHALYITVAHETSDFAHAGVSSYTGTSPNWGFLGRGGKIWVEKKGTKYYVNGGAMSFTTGSVDSYGGAYLTEVPGGGDSGGSSGSGITVIECEFVADEDNNSYTLTNADLIAAALADIEQNPTHLWNYGLYVHSAHHDLAGNGVIAGYTANDEPVYGFRGTVGDTIIMKETYESGGETITEYDFWEGAFHFSPDDIDENGTATMTSSDDSSGGTNPK